MTERHFTSSVIQKRLRIKRFLKCRAHNTQITFKMCKTIYLQNYHSAVGSRDYGWAVHVDHRLGWPPARLHTPPAVDQTAHFFYYGWYRGDLVKLHITFTKPNNNFKKNITKTKILSLIKFQKHYAWFKQLLIIYT